ncbi:MAG: MFS transporter [Actinobacteria bacterium]|nr:MFS transporter [Actinomycetota bacterium]
MVAAAFALESALFSTLSPLLPHYESEFAMSRLASGVLAASYTAGMVVGTLIAGLWASARFGVRATALVGCALLAGSSLVFGAADSVLMLDLTRGVQGIAAGLVWCSLLGWLILLTPAEARGRMMGAALGAAVFGSASGPLLGAATQVVGTFAVFAAIAAAVAVYTVVLSGAEPPPRDEGTLPELRLPRDRQLRWIAAIGFVPPLLIAGVVTILPLQLVERGASEAGVDAVLLVGSLVAAVGCIAAGRAADRRGYMAPVVVGIVASALSLVVMSVAGSPLALGVGYALFQGLGLGFFWVPLTSLFTHRGESIGMSAAAAALVLNLSFTVASTIGPPLLTGLEQGTTEAMPYLAMAGLTLLCLAAVMQRRLALGSRVAVGEAQG